MKKKKKKKKKGKSSLQKHFFSTSWDYSRQIIPISIAPTCMNQFREWESGEEHTPVIS